MELGEVLALPISRKANLKTGSRGVTSGHAEETSVVGVNQRYFEGKTVQDRVHQPYTLGRSRTGTGLVTGFSFPVCCAASDTLRHHDTYGFQGRGLYTVRDQHPSIRLRRGLRLQAANGSDTLGAYPVVDA
jgi:hypothetical protein